MIFQKKLIHKKRTKNRVFSIIDSKIFTYAIKFLYKGVKID